MAGPVVVVTGPPGAGKTTVSRRLATGQAKGVHMETDHFFHFVVAGWLPPWKPESQAQNEVVIDVIAGAAFTYATGGYAVVVDGIVGPWFLERFLGPLVAGGVAVSYVVLRPDAETAYRRAMGRGSDALTADEPIRKMYKEFSDLGPYERNVVDSSSMSLDETVAAVQRGVDAGVFSVG